MILSPESRNLVYTISSIASILYRSVEENSPIFLYLLPSTAFALQSAQRFVLRRPMRFLSILSLNPFSVSLAYPFLLCSNFFSP